MGCVSMRGLFLCAPARKSTGTMSSWQSEQRAEEAHFVAVAREFEVMELQGRPCALSAYAALSGHRLAAAKWCIPFVEKIAVLFAIDISNFRDNGMDRFAAMRVFIAVADAGQPVGAGRRLSMPLATVSRHLAALEEQLGLRLFTRTTRRLALTEPGRSYLDASAACSMSSTQPSAGLAASKPSRKASSRSPRPWCSAGCTCCPW